MTISNLMNRVDKAHIKEKIDYAQDKWATWERMEVKWRYLLEKVENLKSLSQEVNELMDEIESEEEEAER